MSRLRGPRLGFWVWQGMTGGAKAHHDGIVAFSETDFTVDLDQISVPMLVMHATPTRSSPTPPPRHCPHSS